MGRTKVDGNKGRQDNLYLRGDTWYIRFWEDGKEVRRVGGKDKKMAQEKLGLLRADAARGKLGLAMAARSAPTLSEYKAEYLRWANAHKRSAERDERSLLVLEPVFGNTKLSMITRAAVMAYQQARLDHVSGATTNREVACLRKIGRASCRERV